MLAFQFCDSAVLASGAKSIPASSAINLSDQVVFEPLATTDVVTIDEDQTATSGGHEFEA